MVQLPVISCSQWHLQFQPQKTGWAMSLKTAPPALRQEFPLKQEHPPWQRLGVQPSFPQRPVFPVLLGDLFRLPKQPPDFGVFFWRVIGMWWHYIFLWWCGDSCSYWCTYSRDSFYPKKLCVCLSPMSRSLWYFLLSGTKFQATIGQHILGSSFVRNGKYRTYCSSSTTRDQLRCHFGHFFALTGRLLANGWLAGGAIYEQGAILSLCGEHF